jgi:hypothetical protein
VPNCNFVRNRPTLGESFRTDIAAELRKRRPKPLGEPRNDLRRVVRTLVGEGIDELAPRLGSVAVIVLLGIDALGLMLESDRQRAPDLGVSSARAGWPIAADVANASANTPRLGSGLLIMI